MKRYFISGSVLLAFALTAAAQDTVLVQAKPKNSAPYTSYATRLVSLLPGFSATTEYYDSYGGWMAASAPAKGYFYTTVKNGRWWIVDPLGHLFLQKGLGGVTPGVSATEQAALQSVYGTVATWATRTISLLRTRGFNDTGAGSDDTDLQRPSSRLPWSKTLGVMESFGASIGGTTPGPGHAIYPKNCIFVFDPRYPAFCDSFAATNVAKYSSDPRLVGYFTDNELPFFLSSLANFLSLPLSDPGHVAAQNWLDARKGHTGATLAEATAADKDAFLAYVVDKYFSITTAAIRKYDPNHMILGSRFYTDDKRSRAACAAAGKYCDIISINFYLQWNPTQQQASNWQLWSGRPFMITEFYTKGADSGLPNNSGAGWIVPTQADRGKFYQNFVLSLLQSKVCVGWHLFTYMDNDPNWADADSSNIDSNKGIVTTSFQEYSAYTGLIQGVNKQCYNLTHWFDG